MNYKEKALRLFANHADMIIDSLENYDEKLVSAIDLVKKELIAKANKIAENQAPFQKFVLFQGVVTKFSDNNQRSFKKWSWYICCPELFEGARELYLDSRITKENVPREGDTVQIICRLTKHSKNPNIYNSRILKVLKRHVQ